ncbi:Enoyl-[acyl-carrier-protein] reductase [NADH] 1, chloroplastic [Capsicum chinense]|nr:Enoyl-[acyl-carrier-protein] reductase [NADH] 1, chloroplastic [Capsicum chinense]
MRGTSSPNTDLLTGEETERQYVISSREPKLETFPVLNVLLEFLSSLGKRSFIAGVAGDNGYGWAIAKSLAAAGAETLVGTWVPEVAESVKEDFGIIGMLVHSHANGPKVSSFEIVKQCIFIGNLSRETIQELGSSSISLTYIASERIIPGYGGGMSSAKAKLESDTRVLAFEAGRKQKVRVNTIAAGILFCMDDWIYDGYFPSV